MWEWVQKLSEEGSLTHSVLGIQIWQYIVAFVSVFLGFTLKRVASLVIKRITKIAEGTKIKIDDIFLDALDKPLGWILLLGGIHIAVSVMPIPEKPLNIRGFVSSISSAGGVVMFAWFLLRLLDGLMDEWGERAKETDSRVDDQIVPLIRKSIKVFVIIVAVVTVLQALGYSISGLIAGLGIGGAAFALASKDTVANVFGSIVVFLDRPFHVGDWIEVGDLEGTVEEVGLRSTKIRTFANSLIHIPNATFTTSSVNNWSRMKKRRIKTTIGLTYDTSPEKMGQAVEAVKNVLRADERIHQDFFLVNFTHMSAYSLDIFIYTFTVTTNWAQHLQVRQEIFLKIMKAIKDLGLKFAFPTQTTHLIPPGEAPEHMERELPI